MIRTLILNLTVLFCLIMHSALYADDFLINAYTTNSQNTPVITTDGTNYLVAWKSYGQDGSGFGIYARLFDEDGTPLTYDIQVNTYTTNNQQKVSVASNGSNYLVIWESNGEYGLTYSIVGQYLDNEGSKIGSPFQITTDDNAQFAKVASNGTDYFVAYAYDESTYWRILGRYIYSSISMSTENVISYLYEDLMGLNVAGNTSKYCIVVDSCTVITGTSKYEYFVRSYMKPSVGGGRMLNIEYPFIRYSYSPGASDVTTDGSNFFVTYHTNDYGTAPEDNEIDVCGRYIDSLNQRVGAEILITPSSPRFQYYAQTCNIAPSCNFTVWKEYSLRTTVHDVYGRSIKDFSIAPSDRIMNTRTAGEQTNPVVASNGNTIFTAWVSSEHDGASYGISGNIIGKEDTDSDGLNLIAEFKAGTDDNDTDSDDDTLSDYYEVMTAGTNPLNEDTDNDMLRDAFEINVSLTDPTDSDSDNDGLEDFEELLVSTDPNQADSDNDGLNDHEEVMVYDTDPNNEDSDSDGYSDYEEIIAGTDPNDGLDYLEITRFNELSTYLGTAVIFIGWNSSPDKMYRVYVQTDTVGPNFLLLEDDVESKGYETFFMDQGGGPNKIPHPETDTNPRLYRVVVKR